MAGKILICDDAEMNRESLKTILVNDYDLILLEDTKQIEDIIEAGKNIGLIFLNVKSNKTSEMKTISGLRQTHPALPIVSIVDPKAEELALQTVQAGASGYITKPFKGETILSLARKHLTSGSNSNRT